MKRKPKVRDVLAELRAAGWWPVRCRGSHQLWRAADGRSIPVVVNHANDDASAAVVLCVRRLLG